ncbi:MAG: HEAT repeat domain-containing protein [Planctomycetes bacterium]|nr:HEAT repeat domain-containing protein [Planctomycetota bacterium]
MHTPGNDPKNPSIPDPASGPKGSLSSTAAAFLKRVTPPAPPKPASHSRRAKWSAPPGKKKLGPQGRVPPNTRGLARDIAARTERAAAQVAAESKDPQSWIRRSPAWAFSLAIHLVAAVVLMNVVYFKPHQRLGQIFRLAFHLDAPGGAKEGDQDNGVKGHESEDSPPAGPVTETVAEAGQPAPDPIRTLPAATESPLALPLSVSGSPLSGNGGFGGIYAGRGGNGRGDALKRYGGDGISEEAVSGGLAWLADHQSPDGCWDISGHTKMCPPGKKCADGREDYWSHTFDAYKCAVTGVATLGFLGAGFTHMDDQRTETAGQGKPPRHPYCDVVDKALLFLCKSQRADGCVATANYENERAMYSHGMAGIALVEAYSLTHDPRLRAHAQLAVNFTCAAQQGNGGWDYGSTPSGRGDTSVTSWQVMLLRSARAAGLGVPRKTWEMARAYMETVTDRKTGEIAYEIEGPNLGTTPGCNAMVAAGWVTRAYLGIADDHPTQEKFAAAIRAVPPRFDKEWGACLHWSMLADRKATGHWTLYYTYYATLAMFHHGGEDWEKWNAKMREVTLGAQRTGGHEKGSWDPVTADASFGGRVYATAMSVMNLEVYYRYLPVYEVGYEFGLSPLINDNDWAVIRDKSVKGNFHLRKKLPADDPAIASKERDWNSVIDELKSADMMTRRNAARDLAQQGIKGAIPALIQAEKVEKTSLRPVLIEYLGIFGPEEAVLDTLIDLLSDESDRIRHAAADGLKKASGMDYGVHRIDWDKWRAENAPAKK